MKIKDCFVLRNIAGINTVISTGAKTSFDGVITLNDTGVFMWEQLSKGVTLDELVDAMLNEYDIDESVARTDAEAFINKLRSIDIFE